MKKTKRVYKMYAAWAFDREIQDLEERSRNGWHLVKGGLFHCKFSFDDTVRYRYALDFNQEIADPVRYRETFAEQGWEFINSTFNGWHYFRKVYDPSQPEEEYQIYTDTASRHEMTNRWKRLAYILGGFELAVGALDLAMNIRHPAIYSICLGLGSVLLGLLLLANAKRIGRSDRRHASGWTFMPVLVLFLAALVFAIPRAGFTTQTEYIVSETEDAWRFSFDVKLPDIYTLDVRVDAPEKVMIWVMKESVGGGVPAEDGDTHLRYYAVEGTQIKESVHLFLTPGTYSVLTQYLSAAEPGGAGYFTYELS